MANAQTVSKDFKAQPLKSALKEIEQQTGLSIIYEVQDVDGSKKITESFKEVPVEKVLSAILGPGLEFTIQNKMILISKKKVAGQYEGTPKDIKGKITDERGESIIGATIQVKGTSNGAITDIDGNFSLTGVPSDATIVVSYIGYGSQELPVRDRNTFAITLVEDSKQLDEVVVVGYGTQSKARVTGSIAGLKGDQIKDMPVTSFEQAIAGRMPGVQVVQQSGAPGSSASMKIRGSSSITAGTNPLIVIDGFPMSTDDMTSLNPEDIESIDVLKDASSSAIYGSRGANGVVVITTKKGKEGKAKISAKAYYGVQSVAKKVDMMDAYEYANFVATARNNYWVDLNPGVNKPSDPNSARPSKARVPDYLVPYLNGEAGLINTDWQDEIFRTAAIQQYDLSVSGGTDRVSYYTSVSYSNQDGVIENSGFNRISARSNLSVKLNKHISFDFDIAPSYSIKHKVSESNHKEDGVVLMTMIANPAAACLLYTSPSPRDRG